MISHVCVQFRAFFTAPMFGVVEWPVRTHVQSSSRHTATDNCLKHSNFIKTQLSHQGSAPKIAALTLLTCTFSMILQEPLFLPIIDLHDHLPHIVRTHVHLASPTLPPGPRPSLSEGGGTGSTKTLFFFPVRFISGGGFDFPKTGVSQYLVAGFPSWR